MSRVRAQLGGAAVCACAAWSLRPLFVADGIVVLLATLLPTALAIAWGWPRRPLPLWFAVCFSAAAWVTFACVVVLGRVSPGGAADALRSLREAWPYMIAAPPVIGGPEVLTGVSGLVWLAAASTAELVRRTGAALAALVPSLTLLLVGVLVGQSVLGLQQGGQIAVTAGYLVLAGLFVVDRQSFQRTGPSAAPAWRWAAAGGAVVAVVAVTAVGLGSTAMLSGHRQPLDLRRYASGPDRTAALPNPLNEFAGWIAEPDAALFTVHAARAQNWRVAVLDRFDGTTWSTSGRFEVAGTQMPDTPHSRPSEQLIQEVTIAGLAGSWLPAASRPVSVSGVAALVDPGTGVLLSRGPVATQQHYQVSSTVDSYDADTLRSAKPASDDAARAALELPTGLPDIVVTTGRTATAGATFPFQQATRLASFLRESGRNDPLSPPGHSYGHIAYFLGTSHRGTSEQFAVAFALIARSLGLPCRLAVGFAAGTPIDANAFAVHGSDALVWPEVAFNGVGWVPFYPTPAPGNTGTGATTPAAGAVSTERERLDQALDQAAAPAGPPGPGLASAVSAPSGMNWLAGGAAATGLLVVAYLAAVGTAPAVRRLRQRRRGWRAAVVGAWAETLGWLGAIHIDWDPALTTRDIVAAAVASGASLVRNDLNELALLADAARYSGRAPTRADADRAWGHSRAVAHEVRQRLGPVRVLMHRLNPRMLRG
jgi:transglutaminase-like putative cysteine protease